MPSLVGVDVYRARQEAAFGANLPELHAGMVELEDEEAGVAAVEQAQAIAPLLDVQVGPGRPLTTMVLPKNSGFQMGEMSLGSPSQAIELDEGDVQVGLVRRLVQLLRRRRGCRGRRGSRRR
jgi:hypothetical protein